MLLPKYSFLLVLEPLSLSTAHSEALKCLRRGRAGAPSIDGASIVGFSFDVRELH